MEHDETPVHVDTLEVSSTSTLDHCEISRRDILAAGRYNMVAGSTLTASSSSNTLTRSTNLRERRLHLDSDLDDEFASRNFYFA